MTSELRPREGRRSRGPGSGTWGLRPVVDRKPFEPLEVADVVGRDAGPERTSDRADRDVHVLDGVLVTRPTRPAALALVLSLLGGVLDGRPEAERVSTSDRVA